MPDAEFRHAAPTGPARHRRDAGRTNLRRTREHLSDRIDRAWTAGFDRIGGDPNQFLAVMTLADGRVIGTLRLTFISHLAHRGATRAQIKAMRVARDVRGGGRGIKMIVRAIAEARLRGCSIRRIKDAPRRTPFIASRGSARPIRGFELAL